MRHKLRALPSSGKEFVLCKGRPDRGLEKTAYFWKNVSCCECKRLKGKK